MSEFSNIWDKTNPTGTDFIRFGQLEIRKTRAALEERLDLEHYGPSLGSQTVENNNADGRHRPGKVSALLIDTYSNINATSPGGTGCMAYATDHNAFYRWNGSTWSIDKFHSISDRPKVSVVDGDITGWNQDTTDLDFSPSFDGSESTYTGVASTSSSGDVGFRVDLNSVGRYELLMVAALISNQSGFSNPRMLHNPALEVGSSIIRPGSGKSCGFQTSTSGVMSPKLTLLDTFYGRFSYITFNQCIARLYRLEYRRLS